MKLKGKLIAAFAIAIVGVVALSVNTGQVMQRNIRTAEIVKKEKLQTILAIEKIASLGGSLGINIQTAVNSASEEGLQQAEKAGQKLLQTLKDVESPINSPDLKAQLDKLPKLIQVVLESGNVLAMAVIDQEFEEIPSATKAFEDVNQKLEGVLVSARDTAVADLELALGQMAAISLKGARVSAWSSAGLVVLMIGLLIYLLASLIRPIGAVVAGLKDVAEGEGDLTMRLSVSSKDEVGELANWFNVFIDKLQGLIKDISGGVETLSSSSAELSAISKQMTQGIQDVSDKSTTVSAAAEEMNANMANVAAAMEQSATNTNMVAKAAEEMSATIGDIAKNTEKARGTSDEAANKAASTSAKIDELGNAANSIGKVVETITEISEQVNLLALNATIEAARAGEAGKGFAVVANEIKELAKQTAEASGDIKEKIEGIQGTTDTTVGQIAEISQVITDVNDVVATIATAVEEQSAATKEIAENVSQASTGIQEVNESVNQSSTVSNEISEDIAGVSTSMDEMSNSSSQVNLSAQELSKLSESLKQMVDQFKV
jgi:methyl-accepting chemotaxis protein